MKRILTVQDISCLGRCSMTIALPVISAMGVETVILPTALLSTHTLFQGCARMDLTDMLRRITEHWQREDIHFDAVYTGYLGREEQIDMMLEVFDTFGGEETRIIVDPVMGDNGRLYSGFNRAYAEKNRLLCGRADIIIPNITEASLMTGIPYREEYGEEYIRSLLDGLAALGPKVAILTGVSLSPGRTGVMGLDTGTGEIFRYQNRRVDASFHGTGDLFSSICTGALMRGLSWQEAAVLAADHTAYTMEVTLANGGLPRFGVDFEETLPALIRELAAHL